MVPRIRAMPLGLAHPVVSPSEPFRDGLGERSIVLESASGEVVEALRLDEALATHEAFVHAARERMNRLAGFEDPRFSTPVSLGPEAEPQRRVALVSRQPAALRLSQVLASAAGHGDRFAVADITNVAVTLTGALAALQRVSKDLSVGTLAAERVLVTADSRVLITEHVFASAFEALNSTREPLWRSYRIAVPQLAGRLRLERHADLVQLGMIVLALIAGRPIGDAEFPAQVPRLVADLFGALPPPGFEPDRFSALRSWVTRALQLEPRRSFHSSLDLEAALGEWVPADSLPPSRSDGASAAVAGGPALPAPAPVFVWSAGSGAAGLDGPASQPIADLSPEPPAATLTEVTPLAGSVGSVDLDLLAEEPVHAAPRPRLKPIGPAPRHMTRWAIGAGLVVGLALCGLLTWRWASRPTGEGTLVIDSRPQGADVRLDGGPLGRTPLRMPAREGAHSVELRFGERRRVIPVAVVRGEILTLSFELRDVRDMGQLEVRSEPTGAEVSIDGRPHGTAPLVADIKAGTHVIRVLGGSTMVQHPVTVEPGRTASLLVSLTAAQARPAARAGAPSRTKSPSRGGATPR